MTPEHKRADLHHETLKAALRDNLNYVIGHPLRLATLGQRYEALVQTVRDRIPVPPRARPGEDSSSVRESHFMKLFHAVFSLLGPA